MSNLEELQKKVRKLQSRAGTAKMELHDLAEDLPVNWTEIKVIAERTFAVFAELDAAKRDLASSENAR
ncbi:CCE_0567 family metalloprotein [Mesorhizobium captivum]|uniref:CCE_0567 family metalloprotein n=1 Tax=Mesorhizobium captivum TaxID=3072319 RepID=UPI002A23F771|nr:CCE_0567 family metalloprotein [Mesorhizobium sp. VK23E]MDX8514690.1 CCE_0567 family metalloprotein [Mesorhizobium sp. VK23E]